MKNQKKEKLQVNKLVLSLGIILVLLLIYYVCSFIGSSIKKSEEKDIITKINENSNLPITYMEKYNSKDDSLKKYKVLANFMSDDYYNEDIWFSYYGYPNDESDEYLAKIILYSEKYDILGVKVGSDYKDAIAKIKEYGFSLKNEDTNFEAILTSGKISIELENRLIESDGKDVDKVGKVTLSAESEYLGNRLY